MARHSFKWANLRSGFWHASTPICDPQVKQAFETVVCPLTSLFSKTITGKA
jgi:hypothetical protein